MIETASTPSDYDWGEIWGIEPTAPGAGVARGATAGIETASIAETRGDDYWGEVWGLEPTTQPMAVDAARIETASTPSVDAGWGEVWGL